MLSRREAALGALILFVVVNLAFAPFLWGDRNMMSSSVDASSIFVTGASSAPAVRRVSPKMLDPGAAAWQTEPQFVLEHALLSRGEAPLWNPYVGFGEPFAANLIAQPYYPLTWLAAANPSPRTYNWYIALRFWIAALFAFLFLGYFVRFYAALAGAIAFAFTGYLVIYYDLHHASVEILVPALLWAVERLVRSRGWRDAGVFALVSTAVVFGGMPESALLAFGLAIVYALVRVAADSDARDRWRAIAGRIAAGLALAVLTSSISILPAAEFVPLSLNQHAGAGSADRVVGLAGDPWDPRVAIIYLAPLAYGPPWSNALTGYSALRGYWGVVATFFALVTLFSLFGDRKRPTPLGNTIEAFFAIVAAVLLLKRFAVPVVNWIGALPGFRLIVFPKYEEVITGMAIAALAAFGIERILSGRAPRYALVGAAVVILGVLTLTAQLVSTQTPLPAVESYLPSALAWSLVVLGCAFALSLAAGRARWVRFVGQGAVLLLALDVLCCYLVPAWYVINEPPPIALDAEQGAPYVAYVQRATKDTHERFLGLDGLLYPEWASAFGILDVRDLSPLYVGDFMTFSRTFLANDATVPEELIDRFTGATLRRLDDPLARRFLTLSSIRFVASVPANAEQHGIAARGGSAFATAFETADSRVARYRDPLPRVSVYTRVVGARDTDDALRLLASPKHDIWRVGVVTLRGPDATSVLGDLQNGTESRVTAGAIERYDDRDVVASVNAPSRALAVLNDTDFPGWGATVDGSPVPIVRANGIFRGVEVPAGRHTIAFRYEPGSFRLGLVLTLIGLLAIAFVTLAPFRRRRQEQS